MPQKKNPDILELTRGKTSQVIGYLTAILSTTKGLSSGYSRDLQQIKSAIWSTSKISITALIVIKSMLSEVVINEEKMKSVTENGYIIALDLAENFVLEKIPFRTAHNIVGNLDEDEDLEIVFGGYSTQAKIFAINLDGSPVAGFPVILGEKMQKGFALYDFNGNKRFIS